MLLTNLYKFLTLDDRSPVWINPAMVLMVMDSLVESGTRLIYGCGDDDFIEVLGQPQEVVERLTTGAHEP